MTGLARRPWLGKAVYEALLPGGWAGGCRADAAGVALT